MNQAQNQTAKHADLVYDVGMHTGQDTDFYLKKGFRVVAFEANPDLAARGRERFADAVRDGRLVIVEGAIVEPERAGPGRSVPFFRNLADSLWGTAAPAWVQRNESLGRPSDRIEVPAVDFGACLRAYGIPHYLKIDIEGMDMLCLQALSAFAERPDYVSIETEKESFGKLTADFDVLSSLGYGSFNIVQQASVARQREPKPVKEGKRVGLRFAHGASGLFGADLPGRWLSREETLKRYRRIFAWYRLFGDEAVRGTIFRKGARYALSAFAGRQVPGWHDVHARHVSAL